MNNFRDDLFHDITLALMTQAEAAGRPWNKVEVSFEEGDGNSVRIISEMWFEDDDAS